MTNEELWQAALGEIELSISRANFITWFRGTHILDRKDGVVVISVPNVFTQEWLKNKYNKFVLSALRNLDPTIKELNYVLGEKKETQKIKSKKDYSSTEESQLGFHELQFDKETNLNPKYTFDSFVIGSSNELAYAACQNIVRDPGSSYNPMFIYGGVGLGKTHLLQALGNEIVKKNPKKKIKYITSEKFTNELVSAINNRATDSFKERYRLTDVLIIDDIQFLAGKERTQEEFFHTFNTLHEKNKQIVLSSDRPPKAISTLEERLRSRFEGGMIADISYPDFETRLAILNIKAQEKNLDVPLNVLEYIAQNIQKNIRELEGALNRVIATAKLNKKPLTITKASKVLTSIISQPKKNTSFKGILGAVVSFYDISQEDLLNRNRKKEIVQPRQICMYLLREELRTSYPSIGEKMGGRDHTTVMYACEKIEKEIQNNESLEQEINLIREKIYS